MDKNKHIAITIEKDLARQIKQKMGVGSYNNCIKGLLSIARDYEAPVDKDTDSHIIAQIKYSLAPLYERIKEIEERTTTPP